MKLFRNIVTLFVFLTVFAWGIGSQPAPAWADGDHGHSEDTPKMKMGGEKQMDHPEKEEAGHSHQAVKKAPKHVFPEGTKEVIIDLSGPFCSRHPEEITAGLKQVEGVLDVEAFNRRDYVLIHFAPEKVSPGAMAEKIDMTKGSGWRCKGTVSTRRRTER